MQFKTTPTFDKQAKKLAKKYRSLKYDLSTFMENFEDTHERSAVDIKADVYKVRVKNSDKSKGTSAGYRVYYYLKKSDLTTLLLIYDKSEIENINDNFLNQILENDLK